MSERAKVAEFVSFCIEMFAKAKRLSGDKVAAVFQSCGAIDMDSFVQSMKMSIVSVKRTSSIRMRPGSTCMRV